RLLRRPTHHPAHDESGGVPVLHFFRGRLREQTREAVRIVRHREAWIGDIDHRKHGAVARCGADEGRGAIVGGHVSGHRIAAETLLSSQASERSEGDPEPIRHSRIEALSRLGPRFRGDDREAYDPLTKYDETRERISSASTLAARSSASIRPRSPVKRCCWPGML